MAIASVPADGLNISQFPTCFLYRSQNRHLSYLDRLRESDCAVIEIPNANHFLFYDAPNHYTAALASFARSSWFLGPCSNS